MNVQGNARLVDRIGSRGGDDRGPNGELLTPREVAALFHVNPKTVARWAQEGKIGSTRTAGGHRRYHRTEIRALLNKLTEPGPASPHLGAVRGAR